MPKSLKEQLEVVAREEGKTFTELVVEGAELLLSRRQVNRPVAESYPLPLLSSREAYITSEDVKRALHQLDLDYARRNSGMRTNDLSDS